LAAGALVLLASLLLGCIQLELLGGGRKSLVETVVYSHGDEGERGAKFLLVEVDGIIHLGDNSSFLGTQESTVARIREQLDAARRDSNIRGLLLRIDSPGGGATASDLIYGELLRFKRDRDVPIVAHFLGMAASGGYYVAMAADEIVAEPTTVTGSIGVIFAGVNLSGLMKRWGIEDQTLTAGRYKDAGSMLRPQTDEERAILQSVIDDLYDRFRSVVDTGRPGLGRERVDALADGRLYSANQALENGLVDRVGDIEEAVARLQERAGVSRSVVVSYHRPSEWRRNLYTRSSTGSAAFESPHPAQALLERLKPGFLYLWPGASQHPWSVVLPAP
jgi:protease-4